MASSYSNWIPVSQTNLNNSKILMITKNLVNYKKNYQHNFKLDGVAPLFADPPPLKLNQ